MVILIETGEPFAAGSSLAAQDYPCAHIDICRKRGKRQALYLAGLACATYNSGMPPRQRSRSIH